MIPATFLFQPMKRGFDLPTLAPPRIPRKLDNREEKLDTLLTHYIAAQETLQLGDGPAGDNRGDRLLLMPMTWNMAYRTLEKLLRYMRHTAEEGSSDFRARYFALNAWYITSQARRTPLMRKDKKNRPYHVVTAGGPQYVLEVCHYDRGEQRWCQGRGGDPVLVFDGLVWLAGHFPGAIDLPREFLEAA